MNAAAYLAQLQQLMPPGLAWSRDGEATLTGLLTALAEGLAVIDARAGDLIDETDPRTALEMLKDWETVAGLPDACSAAVADTIRERQGLVHAKVTGRGGQSRQYFIDQATALGYSVTITEFLPFTCETPCEANVTDESWRFVWRVNAPATTLYELTCETPCDEALRDWGNEILECVITADKPAHTHVNFAYGA